MKKILVFLLIFAMLLSLVACGGGEKTLHCDRCNAEVQVGADSNMDDSWIISAKTALNMPAAWRKQIKKMNLSFQRGSFLFGNFQSI